MNVPARLAELAGVQGEKQALVWSGGSFTYAELVTGMGRLAAGLAGLRLSRGDRVALQLPNVPEFVVAYYAILRLGAVAVPMNPAYTAREVAYIMADSGAAALITSTADTVESIRGRLPALAHLILTAADRPDRLALEDLYVDSGTDFPDMTDNDLAVLIYTSGTTGRPKGAMLSHGNLWATADATGKDIEITPDERTLIVTPLFHVAAQASFLNCTLVNGGTCYLHERWTNADTVLDAIQNLKISYYFGVPTMYALMLNSPKLAAYDLSSLRVPQTGGAPLPAEIFDRWKETTGAEIIEGYGLSETNSGCIRNPLHGRKKPGSAGLSYPSVDVRIFDDEDRELPPGRVGEIVVRGPNVMMGYWNNPAATAQAMRGGWFHTGDLAYVDEDGYFFIVDRKKDMIIRGGLNIYPREVEEVIYRYPGVLEAAVIGVPDKVMGEEVQAHVVPKTGAAIDVEALRGFCKQELAYYKVPKFVVIESELPKTVSGKILKRQLRDSRAKTYV